MFVCGVWCVYVLCGISVLCVRYFCCGCVVCGMCGVCCVCVVRVVCVVCLRGPPSLLIPRDLLSQRVGCFGAESTAIYSTVHMNVKYDLC